MTTPQAIGVLIIRISAAWWMLWSLASMLTFLLCQGFSFGDRNTVTNVLSYSPQFLVAVAGWVFAPAWIKSVLPAPHRSLEIKLPEAYDLVALGSFLIGVYHLARTLPVAVIHTARAIAELTEGRLAKSPSFSISFMWQDLTAEWAIVLCALFLTFRPGDLAKLFIWLRMTGAAKSANNGEDTTS